MKFNKQIVNGHWFEEFFRMNEDNELPVKFPEKELENEVMILIRCIFHKDYYNVSRVGSYVPLNRRMRHDIFNKWKEAYDVGVKKLKLQNDKKGSIENLNYHIDKIYKSQEINEVLLGI